MKFLCRIYKIYSTLKCRNKIKWTWQDSKQNTQRLGWVIRDLSPRLKKKNLGFPLVKNWSVEPVF